MRGAEAILKKGTFFGKKIARKTRIPKTYRIKELDQKLRLERTRVEARLLHKAKLAGVKCPAVLEVSEFELVLEFIDGKRPEMNAEVCRKAGSMLARLHAADIIHGDYTPANLIKNRDGLNAIDFGLGFISNDVEDKAIDVFTMLRSIGDFEGKKIAVKGTYANKLKQAFLEGYKDYGKAEVVLTRVDQVEKRVRYAN